MMPENPLLESDHTDDEDIDGEEFFEAFNGPLTLYAMQYGPFDRLATELAAEDDMGIIADKIIRFGEVAEQQKRKALQNGTQAIIFAWACGTALNIAKARIPHGEFGPWRDELLKTAIFNVRTSQRYMELARKYGCVKDLTAWRPSLRQAYIACGILPEPPESEKPAERDKESLARVRLVKSVAVVQTRLRRFSAKNLRLDKDTKKQLVAAKSEIDELFKALIG